MKKIYARRPRGAQHTAVQKGCKKAFTLAELLTAVLVISVIMVALAPVITKRMKDNVSVTTDNKKGLEIYANPGTYTFDVPVGINTLFIQGAGGGGGGAGASVSDPRTVTFTSSTTWKVPTGVNQITFEITGSGGGGGGANGASSGATSCENNPGANGKPNSSELAKYPLFHALRISDDGSDLCIFKRNAVDDGTWPYRNFDTTILKTGEQCTSEYCCWYADGENQTAGNGGLAYPYTYPGAKRAVCKFQSASRACASYGRTVNSGPTYGYRLPTETELKKWVKYLDDFSRNTGSNGLQLCCHNYLTSEPNTVPQCNDASVCRGSDWNNRCTPCQVWSSSSDASFTWSSKDSETVTRPSSGWALSVRCVKSLKYYNNYSGSGGSSGAVLEKTINVLPNDTFEITIGQGGAGGASKTKGSQGGTTKIVHKRKNIELGTYYVKGGLGGNPATTSAHGKAYTNGTAANNTTPSGTCYSRNRKDTSDSFTGGNTSCTTISYSGESGSSTKGGNGGRVKNTGSINNGEASSGGYLYVDSSRTANQRATNEEIRLAKGQNASTAGFGGGGGLTPAWANSTSHFYQGGKGANGKVEITYKVALPGGGGGSSARVAGVDNNNKAYEIIYKVSEGDRIVFKVGSGGSGGIENQDGLNGSATVVGDNDIVFLAGEGGKTATDTDKNNLKGGRGGYTSYINEEDNIQSNIQTGIKLKSKTPPITYTINPPNNSFKGQNGTRGGVPEADTIQSGYTITNTIFSYGFNGGMGASPFNVEKSKTAASISCAGGIAGTLGQTTNLKYLCTSGNTKGNDARNHDPVNNEFGGSGGGGGGVKDDSFEQGTGGNGSSGYLRIRWDASEQE